MSNQQNDEVFVIESQVDAAAWPRLVPSSPPKQ